MGKRFVCGRPFYGFGNVSFESSSADNGHRDVFTAENDDRDFGSYAKKNNVYNAGGIYVYVLDFSFRACALLAYKQHSVYDFAVFYNKKRQCQSKTCIV